MNQKIENLYINYRNVDTNFKRTDFFVHSHDYFEIYLFHQGDCNYFVNDETFQLEENDVIVMNGSTLHGPMPNEGTPYERSVIEFSYEWIHPILKKLNVPELTTPFMHQSNLVFKNVNKADHKDLIDLYNKLHLKKMEYLSKQYSKIERRLKEVEEASLLLQILFIVYKLSNDYSNKQSCKNECKSDHVNKIISWMDANYNRNLTLNDIANNLHLSKYYMSRMFKDLTGLTIMEYLMQRRLLRAKYLLEFQPSKSILEVALESGFESASHFSKRFRKYLNITPSAYRNIGGNYENTYEGVTKEQVSNQNQYQTILRQSDTSNVE